MKANFREVVFLLIVYSIGTFCFGIVTAMEKSSCTHKSILSKYDPGYNLGCFLLEERYP
jgi:hypothetical protein